MNENEEIGLVYMESRCMGNGGNAEGSVGVLERRFSTLQLVPPYALSCSSEASPC